MLRHEIDCQVTTRCPLRAYARVVVNVPTPEAMAPYGADTPTCRRHGAMVIEHALARKLPIRIKGVES